MRPDNVEALIQRLILLSHGFLKISPESLAEVIENTKVLRAEIYNCDPTHAALAQLDEFLNVNSEPDRPEITAAQVATCRESGPKWQCFDCVWRSECQAVFDLAN